MHPLLGYGLESMHALGVSAFTLKYAYGAIHQNHSRFNGISLKARAALMDVFSRGVYDLGFERHHTAIREQSAYLSSMFAVFSKHIDNVIDEKGISLDARKAVLRSAKKALYGASKPVTSFPEECAAHELAKYLSKELFLHDGKGVFLPLLDALEENLVAQLEVGDREKALDLEKKVGGASIEIIAATVEVLSQAYLPHMRFATHQLGVYGQMLDGVFDAQKDASHQVRTHATLSMNNSHKVPSEIKQRYFSEAFLAHHLGRLALPTHVARTTYDALSFYVGLKYRHFVPFLKTQLLTVKPQTMA